MPEDAPHSPLPDAHDPPDDWVGATEFSRHMIFRRLAKQDYTGTTLRDLIRRASLITDLKRVARDEALARGEKVPHDPDLDEALTDEEEDVWEERAWMEKAFFTTEPIPFGEDIFTSDEELAALEEEVDRHLDALFGGLTPSLPPEDS